MVRRFFILLALILSGVIGHEESSVEIPMDEIWALGMPGTKDAQKLAADDSAKIRRVLMRRAAEQATADPCFVVLGAGKEAISNAAKIIVEGKKPIKTLPPDKDLSLIFYSFAAPGYVHLDSVHRSSSKVVVKYQVVTHRTLAATVHFASIPLGKLSSGQISVEVVEVPSETPYGNHDRTDRAVCDSCEFVIQHGGT